VILAALPVILSSRKAIDFLVGSEFVYVSLVPLFSIAPDTILVNGLPTGIVIEAIDTVPAANVKGAPDPIVRAFAKVLVPAIVCEPVVIKPLALVPASGIPKTILPPPGVLIFTSLPVLLKLNV
jgi:hypothetical protein